MKAAQINQYGNASVVEIKQVDKPTVGPGQVLVEVYASSLNPIDIAIRSGYLQQFVPLAFPTTLGGDFAGVISAVGEGVKNFKVGEKVFGQSNAAFGSSGAWAEFTATFADKVAKAPDNINFEAAASLPLVGVSAVQALTEHIRLQSGQRILITGGTGGIGSLAIRVAKALGAYVTTTATGKGIEFAKQLGADEVIDYNTNSLHDLPHHFNAVFDTAGGDLFNASLELLLPGGIAVSMSANADEEVTRKLGITAITQQTQVTSSALQTVAKLVEDGVIKPQVSEVFPLDRISDAFVAMESGNPFGKIVIKVRN